MQPAICSLAALVALARSRSTPALAAQARDNLAAAWPQATVVAADGFAFRPDRPADAIVVNSGVTHFSSVWLDTLAAENGRLLVPLTNADRWVAF